MYLDPKSDLAFKKLFGDMAHKNILMSFLNTILERTGTDEIVDVVINDPHNIPETELSKASIVDVRCTDQLGSQYIVEMQLATQKSYAARAQYYSALALARQLSDSAKYETLVPVIFVGILNFKLFASSHYLRHHLFLDSKTYTHELKHFEFHFVESPKFQKDINALETILEKWIYFLINAGALDAVPSKLNSSILHEAFDIVAKGKLSKSELEAYDKYLDVFRSSAGQLDAAYDNGKKHMAREIAKQLIGVLDIATIAQKTGLTIEEVKKLY